VFEGKAVCELAGADAQDGSAHAAENIPQFGEHVLNVHIKDNVRIIEISLKDAIGAVKGAAGGVMEHKVKAAEMMVCARTSLYKTPAIFHEEEGALA
jgi:hypothetical protein